MAEDEGIDIDTELDVALAAARLRRLVRMMNLLRRIATLPGIRHVLLRPTTRRRVASVLALRFLRAALLTTSTRCVSS